LGLVLIVGLSACSPIDFVVCTLNGGFYSWGSGWCLPHHTKSAAASAGDALFVSATAHVAGAAGTNWRTDLQVHNLADESASVRVDLLVHGADNSSPDHTDLNLDPGESLRLGDVLAGEFGVAEGQAALVLRPSSGRIIVTSRTYNLLGAGNQLGLPAGSTFGQFIPARPMSDAIRYGEHGRLIQLSHSTSSSGGFRANLGVVNATTEECRVEVELYDAGGGHLGTVPVVLPPLGYRQLNRVFASVTSGDVDDGYAVVRSTTIGGAFFAYASVVDNLTGDPVAVSATRLPDNVPGGVGNPIYVAASAHVAGSAGTNWRTDLEVHCFSDEGASYRIELLEHGANNSNPRAATFDLDPGESARFEDVLASVFSFEGAAALRITPTAGRVLVTSRTYNLLGEGNDLGLPAGATFGQYIPGLTADDAVGFGDQSRLIQLSHSTDDTNGFRTNLVVVNATGGPIDVEVEMYRADGTHLGTVVRSLAPYEYRQLNRVFASVTESDVEDGYSLVRTTTEGGSFFALASVVDNSTGDPVGMTGPVILSANGEAVYDEVDGVLAVLGQTDLERLVGNTQDLGIGGVFDGLVAGQSEVATRTSDGMFIDYGDGWLGPDGVVREGSIDVDASGLSVTPSGINGTVNITTDDLIVDGEPAPVGSSAWDFDLTERGNGSVVGEITVSPQGGAKSSGSISGTIGIDTEICLEYPTHGSLTVVIAGETITITFSPDCDGKASYSSSGSSSDSFEYGFGSPAGADALYYLDSISNAEVGQEAPFWYWRSSVGAETLGETTPGVITFHFPFDRPVVSGRLLVRMTTFHWDYSQGHSYLYGSTDGDDWQLLSEVEPPAHGEYTIGGWSGDLPEMFIGESDIWLEVRLYAYGPTAYIGGVRCNTAQLSRWQEGQASNTFELEVELE
jgi:hypothetical protein